jgi:hypothetical protein
MSLDLQSRARCTKPLHKISDLGTLVDLQLFSNSSSPVTFSLYRRQEIHTMRQ